MSLRERITWIRAFHVAANIASERGQGDLADTLRFLGRRDNTDLAEIESSVGRIAKAKFRAVEYERVRPPFIALAPQAQPEAAV